MINAAVAAAVPRCAERVDAAIYHLALHSRTVEEAFRYLKRIEDKLPIPLVKPWQRSAKTQQKSLATTGGYSKGNTDPRDIGHRDTEPSHAVRAFGPDHFKPDPQRGKISPPMFKKIPKSRVCKHCGVDYLAGWHNVGGKVMYLDVHHKCRDHRVQETLLHVASVAGTPRNKILQIAF